MFNIASLNGHAAREDEEKMAFLESKRARQQAGYSAMFAVAALASFVSAGALIIDAEKHRTNGGMVADDGSSQSSLRSYVNGYGEDGVMEHFAAAALVLAGLGLTMGAAVKGERAQYFEQNRRMWTGSGSGRSSSMTHIHS